MLDLAVVAVDDQCVHAPSDQRQPVVDLDLGAAGAQFGRDAACGSVVARTDRGGKNQHPHQFQPTSDPKGTGIDAELRRFAGRVPRDNPRRDAPVD